MTSKNVLVVDDDKELTQSVKAYLEARGYAVRTAHSGAEGQREIESARPDLVVLDIMMDSDADGFNLAYKLKGDEATRDIPIIILSGFTGHLKDKFRSFEFVMEREWPAAVHLEKPASLAAIGAAIEQLLANA